MKPFRYFIFSWIIFLGVDRAILSAQTANKMVANVYQQLQKAKDYQADAIIKVDLPFIKIGSISAKILLKQPDKFKVESKSITILPRQGFDQLQRILRDTAEFTAIKQQTEKINGTLTQVISLIPIRDTGDLILARLWIDPRQHLVLQSLLTTKNNGTIHTDYVYGQFAAYGLPDRMTFTVDIKKFKIPKTIAADIHTNSTKAQEDQKDHRKGKITISLSNYTINKGIPDSVFKQGKSSPTAKKK
jgi:hypothetical protein